MRMSVKGFLKAVATLPWQNQFNLLQHSAGKQKDRLSFTVKRAKNKFLILDDKGKEAAVINNGKTLWNKNWLNTLSKPTLRNSINNALLVHQRRVKTILGAYQVFKRDNEENFDYDIRKTKNGQELKSSTLDEIAHLAQGSLSKARLFLDEELALFRKKLFKMLSEKPLRGVDLTRETIGIVEAVGKEPAVRRTRLRLVLDLSVDFFRTKLHVVHGLSCLPDNVLESTIDAYSDSPEEIVQKLEYSLDARQSVDRNANLGILVDAWTAKLERA